MASGIDITTATPDVLLAEFCRLYSDSLSTRYGHQMTALLDQMKLCVEIERYDGLSSVELKRHIDTLNAGYGYITGWPTTISVALAAIGLCATNVFGSMIQAGEVRWWGAVGFAVSMSVGLASFLFLGRVKIILQNKKDAMGALVKLHNAAMKRELAYANASQLYPGSGLYQSKLQPGRFLRNYEAIEEMEIMERARRAESGYDPSNDRWARRRDKGADGQIAAPEKPAP